MKKTLIPLILTFGAILLPFPSQAQEDSGCFMVDSNGRALDLSAICGTSPRRQTLPNGVYSVPIKRRLSGIPVIEVIFNGRQTFEMMLDTGASGTVLTPAMAATLGVKPEGVIAINTPSDTGVLVPVGRVSSISVGGAVARDLGVIISPALDVGLLGQNFFGNYDVSIKERAIEFRVR